MKRVQIGHHQNGRKYKEPLAWAKIDDGDFPKISQFKWYGFKDRKRKVKTNIYAVSNIDGVHTRMHRFILDAPKGTAIDHVNGDTLDNRRENLRFATNSQNQMNRGAQRNSKSGIKGVCWDKQMNKWRASIAANGKKKYLGLFKTKEEAFERYQSACKELHGDFARITNELTAASARVGVAFSVEV